MRTTQTLNLAMGAVLALGVGLAGLSACGAEERQRGAEKGQRQVLTKDFVLGAKNLAELHQAFREWQEEGEQAAGALKEIALSPTRERAAQWYAIQDLHRLQPWDAETWCMRNLALHVPMSVRRGSEAIPDYPCANALANSGWSAVVALIRSAETKQEDEWMRLAGLVISKVARKQAHAVVLALQRVDTGLVKYLK